MSTTYEVEKFARGMRGQWAGFGARRFATLDAAKAYFESFAADQQCVLSNGIRIDLRTRKGRKTLATVGGLLDSHRAKQIRWIDAEAAS